MVAMEFYYDAEKNQFVKTPEFDGHLGRRTLRTLKQYPERIHQIEVCSDTIETNESFRLRSVRAAQAMKARGLKKGDIIWVTSVNHNDTSVPFVASTYIGVMAIPIAVGISAVECQHFLSRSVPKLIFVDLQAADHISEIVQTKNIGAEIIVFNSSSCKKYTPFSDFLTPTGTEDNFVCDDFDPAKTMAFAVPSSGTTGLPKLVAMTHENFMMRMFITLGINARLSDKDSLLNFSPLCWLTGTMNIFVACLFPTTRMHSMKCFGYEVFKHAVETYKPTVVVLGPMTMSSFVKHDNIDNINFSSVRLIITTGSSLNNQTMKRVLGLLPKGIIAPTYAGTEPGSVSMNPGVCDGSVGKIDRWVQWKIVDPITEKELGPYEIGELRIKSLTVFTEYFNDPMATNKAFDADNFYKTGDLMYFDNDKKMFVVDRMKDTIKFRNMQVNMTEIEVKIGCLPEVLHVAVVGYPDEVNGEVPKAFVELVPGKTLTTKDIKEFIKENLEDHKQLRGGVVIVDKFPQTHSGKINRKILHDWRFTMKGQ